VSWDDVDAGFGLVDEAVDSLLCPDHVRDVTPPVAHRRRNVGKVSLVSDVLLDILVDAESVGEVALLPGEID